MSGQAIHSFQSRDWLEDLEGKTSIEPQDKPVNFSSVSQLHIFRSPLKRTKTRYVNKKVLGICNQILDTCDNISVIKQCDKTL